jgi:hypothetical protein
MMELSQGLTLLKNLTTEAEKIEVGDALARYLSDFALHFVVGAELLEPRRTGQPDFWLFLPFATAPDFLLCSAEQIRDLALASTCMIIYNTLFDAAVDDPAKPDITTQVLAECALTSMHEHLYRLFPVGSPFWEHYKPLYERFLGSMIEECSAHKGRPQPYTYADYVRISREKMSMVLMNPVGLAILGNVPERIPELLAAWDEMDTAVVILDDIKDWEEDFQQGNYTYLLTEALHIEGKDQPMPETQEDLVTQVIFSGVMEEMYRRGAEHMERAAEWAEKAMSPALATLAQERAVMFRKFGNQLRRRKLDGLQQRLAAAAKAKEEVP